MSRQRDTGRALPADMYRDPMEAAMRAEATSCKGCKSLGKLLGREFCGIGRRELKKCKKFKIEG